MRSGQTGCAPPVCVAVEPDRRGGHSGRRKPGVDSQPRGAGRAAAVAAETDVTGIEKKRPESEPHAVAERSEEHTSELQSIMRKLVCRLLIEKKNINKLRIY